MNEYIIRKETPADWAEVETLTREAFWNVYRPGCDEHLLVHNLRNHPDCIEALNHVVEYDGRIVGHILYSHSRILNGNESFPAITFGPLSVIPDMQRKGVGSLLVRHTLPLAKAMGFSGVLIEGNPDYYHRFGFIDAENYGISMSDGTFSPCMIALEFIPGALHHAGSVQHAAAYTTDHEQLIEFEKRFPPKVMRAPRPGDLN